ncbi:MAG: methyltransferase domain-containing protein [Thermoanaerobaculia bacterium]
MPLLRTGRSAVPPDVESAPPDRHSLALAEVLRTVAAPGKTQILDLGPANGANVAYLSRYACTLHIADLYRTVGAADGENEEVLERAFDRQIPQGTFDLVLAWDLFDYLGRTGLQALGRQLAQRTAPGGLLFALVSFHPRIPDRPHRFQIVDPETLRYGDPSGLERPAPGYREPDLIRLMPGFEVGGSYLLRHGVQEYLLTRRQRAAADGDEAEQDVSDRV